eukprot:TRINITY_DN5267_c0_g2_i1.p1 TRINITY_DN5267_c0_g2~~TRINITY_DN5267_c0_g2_i1.p1  ORF type:complete len:131 (-),score=19.41 TRINITY_DN5267_c0_g2_i1:402-794(-)
MCIRDSINAEYGGSQTAHMSALDGWRGDLRAQSHAMSKVHDHMAERQAAQERNLDITASTSRVRSELRLVKNSVNRLGEDLGIMRTNPKKYGLSHSDLVESEAAVVNLLRQIESASGILADGQDSGSYSR